MASTIHLKLDGIDGESTTKDHRGEIEVLSWSWGLTSTAGAPGGGGSGAGRATPLELRFVHRHDKASPLIAKAAAAGRHLRTAVLSVRRAGTGQRDHLKITLKEVAVTALACRDDGSGANEEVALAYGAVDVAYLPVTPKGGSGAPVTFEWNVRTGQVG